MHKLLVSCALLFSLSLFAGCATTVSGLGEEGGNATLPSGLTLLDSDEGRCDGTVQVEEATLDGEGGGLEGEFFVESGENATFELEDDDEDIEWACIDDDSSEEESMDCPSGATHVRMTRATEGGELLIECYGYDT